MNDNERQQFACKVCGNYPNDEGELQHGRGCYVLSEDGGGSEYFPECDSERIVGTAGITAEEWQRRLDVVFKPVTTLEV